MKDFLGMRKSS